MGGTRCNFRDCKVSTSRNPGVHFFHFPRQSKRLEDWIRFSDLKNFLEIPESQQKNKVICGRHFRASSFMNYKQDRLVPTAVPTITRLNSKWALDFQYNFIRPKLVQIDLSNAPHLIPPPDFKDPQCFNGEDQKFCSAILKDYGINDSADTNQEPISKRSRYEELKTVEITKGEDRFTEEFLENLINDDVDWTENTTNVTLLRTEVLASSTQRNETCLKEKRIKELEALLSCADQEHKSCLQEKRIKELEGLLSCKEKDLKETKAQLDNKDRELCLAHKRIKSLTEETEQMKQQLTNETNTKQTLKALISNSDLKYKELLNAFNELKEQQQQSETKEVTATLVKKETIELERRISQHQQLSKRQLFNGIKRYLSQNMVALLRLQLASCGTEREWKPDEKRLAIDLLSLGADVYKYFTDEWLIRLPSIHLASDWRNQFAIHYDEDEL